MTSTGEKGYSKTLTIKILDNGKVDLTIKDDNNTSTIQIEFFELYYFQTFIKVIHVSKIVFIGKSF